MRIVLQGNTFQDEHGRTLLLRGVNLGGSSKVPATPDGATWRAEGFFSHRDVSFVGRPFPLEEAEEHLARLQAWGLHFLRFVFTWEAVEHAGPGEYDEEYLSYLHDVIALAGTYGMTVWMDPHQDVWSRWTGGDGAPGWTLEELGFVLPNMEATGAALVHALHGDPLPQMVWPTNGDKMGAATLFSLFFGGDDFAPKTTIRGEPVQLFLQRHYIGALQAVARRLQGFSHVVGFGTMNEPGRGWIGLDLNAVPPSQLLKGPTPTPWQAMVLASGVPQTVGCYEPGPEGPQVMGEETLNPDGVSLWREGFGCPWKANGVWSDDSGEPVLLRPGHFQTMRGRAVDFANDYLKPFLVRTVEALQDTRRDLLVFVEGQPFAPPPLWTADDPQGVVHGVHWYDGVPLIMKVYNPAFTFDTLSGELVMGEDAVRDTYLRQLAHLKDESEERMKDIPVCVGEFGLPFDLDDKAAYTTGDFSSHIQALDAYYRAMDALFLSCTLWNYTADNTNARGDQWNDEDLSIFSLDQQEDPLDLHSGGRALSAIVRPYPKAVAGTPVSLSYDCHSREFRLVFRHASEVHAPTEVFVPAWAYPHGVAIECSDGAATHDASTQLLTWRHDPEIHEHELVLRPAAEE